MSPKSGKAGSVVSPADAQQALEADKANPGEVEAVKAEQKQTQSGKYGSQSLKPNKPPESDEEREKKKSWIEFEMVDGDNKPVTGVAYRVTLPDGETVTEGTLDEKGSARIEGIAPGSCKITFPKLDQGAWETL